jgi:hypothetical protein
MSEISDKSSDAMNTSEASQLIRLAAEPRVVGDSVKAAQRRVLHRLNEWCRRHSAPGWSANRVRDIWNSDQRIRLRVDEAAQLRALTAARRDQEAANVVTELQERISRLERLLAAADTAAHCVAVDPVRDRLSQAD